MKVAVTGVEVVHHLVAVISLRQEDPVAWRVNTEGVGTVARAALRSGVRRMVSCGSLASYHYARGGTVHEGSARAADPRLPVYHRSKYHGEVELRKVVDAGLDALVCNPTGIYGPADHPDRLSRMNQALLDAARGKLPVRLLETVAPFVDPVARRFGSESFAPAALENVAMSPVVDRTKAGAELGYEPRPTAETVADLVAFFGERGLL
ncbi:MAG: NAD-dependent epimerase/dehydratase family protein [Nocardioidaceae bacterium]|nr:NAD-dependent epimerase/dehydratase family protein [Nocardioidaceae bacterium]